MKIKISWHVARDNQGDYHLQMRDVDAGIRFLDATISAKQFAAAITASDTEIEADVRDLELVGKVLERRVISVLDALLAQYPMAAFRQSLATAVAPHEVDGWQAIIPDRYNSHAYDSKTGQYSVSMHRWVDRVDRKEAGREEE